MKQLFRLCLLAFVLIQVKGVAAHAVVTDYSLKLKPIAAHKQDTVELIFNSKIELGLSQVFLVRKGDVHEPLAIKSGPREGQMIINIPALEPGDYAIKFKVFAADGHLTEDVIHFSVAQ